MNRALTAVVLSLGLSVPARSADIDPIQIALLVDGMAGRGSSYDAAALHALGTEGLAAALDYLLPDTAPPTAPRTLAAPDDAIRRLIARLDADQYAVREAATQELILKARGQQALIEEAAQSDSLEVRMRVQRVLASWKPQHAERLSAYLSGFWTYLEGISDSARLKLLARRTMAAFEPGMPEGDRLHLLRLCIAGVAHGRDDPSCDILRPLVRHDDVRIATLVTETVGAYKTEPRFVPELLVEALTSDRSAVVEAALRFVVGCRDEKRREAVYAALKVVFNRRDEPLKFQSCLPLVRDFQDADAWLYVLEQTVSKNAGRVRTALNWIGDTKNCGRPPAPRLFDRLGELLASHATDQRQAAIQVLGTFAGDEVVRRLIDLLADSDASVVRQVDAAVLAQPDRALVQRLLAQAATGSRDPIARERAAQLLNKLPQ